jgi:predicted O-linked N-acetylglucosamine transferase (SPINDLY family)
MINHQKSDLQVLREKLATQYLNSTCDEIKAVYKGENERTHKMLLKTKINNLSISDSECRILRYLDNFSNERSERFSIQILLASMLYLPLDKVYQLSSVSQVPEWFQEDYLNYLLTFPSPNYSNTQQYFNFFQSLVDELHFFIDSNSTFSSMAANIFAKNANMAAIYFNDVNLRDIYIKRADIIDFFLTRYDHPIDCDFGERAVGRSKIRLGILAAHYSAAAETFAALPAYEYLTRDFEVILYSFQVHDTEIEDYCYSRADVFRILSSSLTEQVSIIRADELDILFVATNVTAVTNQICLLAAHRLARIQVTSCASVTTTGLKNIDFYISGSDSDPLDEAQKSYREKLIKMEGTVHCFSYPIKIERNIFDINRSTLGILNETIVYISGANYYKISYELFHLWAQIIARVNDSILVLLPFGPNWSSSYPKQDFIDDLAKIFAQHGLSEKQLMVLDPSPIPTREDVKSILEIADVYLDSFPFAGTTSLIEPLQVCLPVVSLQGNQFRAAMGSALLRVMNLDALVAKTQDQYLEIAVQLGNNNRDRQILRDSIRTKMENCPVFLDSRGYSAQMEKIFKRLFCEYIEQQFQANLKLGSMNLVAFPDWHQPEEVITEDLSIAISNFLRISVAPDTTLIFVTHDVSPEDASLFLSSVAMQLLMDENLDISAIAEISLIGKLSPFEWDILRPMLTARLGLKFEDRRAIAFANAEDLKLYQKSFS